MKAKKDNSLFEHYGFTKTDAKKYPVISGILKELTPERIEKEIKEIQKVKLPLELQKWVKEYEKVGDRDSFLWKWAYKSIPLATFPIVIPKYYKSLLETKFLLIIFITLLDDIADKFKNKKVLKEILKIPCGKEDIKYKQFKQNKIEYLKFSKKIWNFIKKTIKKYPQYKELKYLFEHDISQIVNTMKYAHMVNENPYVINKTEYCLYFPYNLPIVLSCDIDLACSRFKFFPEEIGNIREIAWYMQRVTQAINWITTWEREIREKDFTSGVFAYAIDSGLFKIEDLKKNDTRKLINEIRKACIEKKIIHEYLQDFKVNNFKKKTKIKLDLMLGNLEKFIILQFSSRGNY